MQSRPQCWRGFHHHATLCIAAYGFLVSERSRFSPQPAPAILDYAPSSRPGDSSGAVRRVRPERHNPHSIATLKIALARHLESESGLGPVGSPENWRCVVFDKLRRVELLNGT